MLGKDHVQDLIPDYLLDGLDASQTIQVSAHLVDCPICEEELRACQQVLDDLPLALAERQPPAALKQRLMSQIASPSGGATERSQLSWRQRWSNRSKGLLPAWGFVSLALILVLAVSNLLLWQNLSRGVREDQASMRVIDLAGTANAPTARGKIVVSTDGKYGTLVVENLEALDPSEQYQLWLIKDGERTSGGVFSVYRSGYASMKIDAPEPLGIYQSFGVTIEPEGGSPGPTGEKVLGGEA